jgi:hypothetical protein
VGAVVGEARVLDGRAEIDDEVDVVIGYAAVEPLVI